MCALWTQTPLVWYAALHATKKSIGQWWTLGTLSAANTWQRDGCLSTSNRSAKAATCKAVANNGFTAKPWQHSTALAFVKLFTRERQHKNPQQMKKLKTASDTMKSELQPYSQKELQQIAGSVESYRTTYREEYVWEDATGQIHVAERVLPWSQNERLHVIAKDLYIYGARQKKPKASFVLKVIGQTIC
tara:strand:+ start:2591 stop:3157 length:567 start_codon:yes stop_codon:yes gene_type:complete